MPVGLVALSLCAAHLALAQPSPAPNSLPGATATAGLSAAVEAARLKAQGGDSKDLLKLADGGDAAAQFLVGTAYMRGAGGLPKDPAKACAYEEKAAASRADALHLTGECYSLGLGRPADPAKAKAAYQRAIDMGYGPSKCALGKMLISEGPEAARGISLCSQAAQAGDVAAQVVLGQTYREGRGVKADPKEARRWYEMAAAQKHPAATRILGEMYYAGEGGKKDKKKAGQLWQTAEAAGDGMAPILTADFMFNELTGGKSPGGGKFKIPAGTPLSRIDDITAWYQQAAKRDPRPEARQRAELSVKVLSQIRAGLAGAGHK